MKHLIVGTAGHIDHGKTALIHALTGVDTDRLAEEKRRGITIDLGFASLELPGDIHLDIVDVPGHEHFVKNMLAGAGAIALALMVVAADEGVMPQTREHLRILSLLGVRHGIVVFTRCDLADEETRALAREDAASAFAGSFLENAPVVEVCAPTGEGIPALLALLGRTALEIAAPPVDRPFFLPVDRVFTVKGFGTVVTGSVLDGRLTATTELRILPGGKSARVRGLQSFGGKVAEVHAGQRAAVNLAGIEASAIRRGDVLVGSPHQPAGRMLDVKLYLDADSPHVLENNARLHLSIGSACIVCRARLFDVQTLHPGESGYARLRLDSPTAARPGDRFVIRYYSPVETIGGGVLLDAAPPPRRKVDRTGLDRLACCENGTHRDRILCELTELPQCSAEMRKRFWYLSDGEFAAAWDGLLSEETICLAGELAMPPDRLAFERARFTDVLAGYHAAHPLEDGMPLTALRGQFLAGLILWFIGQGIAVRLRELAALPEFSPYDTPLFLELGAKITALYDTAGYSPPDADAAIQSANLPPETARQVIHLLLRRGDLVETTPGLYFSRMRYEGAQDFARHIAAAQGNLTLAALRDALQTSRRYAQALLERFDADGFTRREGDLHICRAFYNKNGGDAAL